MVASVRTQIANQKLGKLEECLQRQTVNPQASCGFHVISSYRCNKLNGFLALGEIDKDIELNKISFRLDADLESLALFPAVLVENSGFIVYLQKVDKVVKVSPVEVIKKHRRSEKDVSGFEKTSAVCYKMFRG